MSRCIAKLMYLEKPKRLIIWDGWSKRYFDKQNESENCLILLLPIVFHQISPSNLVYISYWPHCNQVYGWSMHIKHLWCCLTARTFKYTHTESKCQVLGTSADAFLHGGQLGKWVFWGGKRWLLRWRASRHLSMCSLHTMIKQMPK